MRTAAVRPFVRPGHGRSARVMARSSASAALAVAMSVAVVVSGTPVFAATSVPAAVVPPMVEPAAAAPAVAGEPGAYTAPDNASAVAAAVEVNEPVEVLAERTETSSTWARPDGLRMTSRFAGPVWVRQEQAPVESEEGWAAVDLRLELGEDGLVRPRSHPRALVLSGGGPAVGADLVQLQSEDGSVAWEWPETLPAPRLSGSRAYYEDVRPGIDVVVEATRTGFAQFFVLRERPQGGRMPELPLTLRTEGVQVVPAPEGHLELLDANGERIGAVPAPHMWDAAVDQQDKYPVGAGRGLEVGFGAGEPVKQPEITNADVPGPTLRRDGVNLTRGMQPEHAVLTATPAEDQAARAALSRRTEAPAPPTAPEFEPLAVPGHGTAAEPAKAERHPVAMRTEARGQGRTELALTPDADFLADADTEYPVIVDPQTAVFVHFDTLVQEYVDTIDYSGSSQLKLGAFNGSTRTRSFMHFDLSGLWDARILSSNLSMWNWDSHSCEARPWRVYETGHAGPGTRWNSQPGFGAHISTSWETRGYEAGGCGDGFAPANITEGLQRATDRRIHAWALGITAENEYDQFASKRFDSQEAGYPPRVDAIYDTRPLPASGLSITEARGDGTVSSATPELSFTPRDSDGGHVTAVFYVYENDKLIHDQWATVLTGTRAVIRLPAGLLKEDRTYKFRATSHDGREWGPDGYNRIVPVYATGRSADIRNCSVYPGEQVQLWDSSDAPCQRFALKAHGGGYYSFPNRNGTIGMDQQDCGTSFGTSIRSWYANDSNCMQYYARPMGGDGDGRTRLESRHSGLVIDVAGGGTGGNGARFQLWGATGCSCQEFRILPAPDPGFAEAKINFRVVTTAVPGAPTSLSVSPGNGSGTARWSPPTSDGGTPLTGYDWEVRDPANAVIREGLPGLSTSATVTGLDNGTTYTFRVWAINARGAGPVASRTFVPKTTPSAPSPVSATASPGQVAASWPAPNWGGDNVASNRSFVAELFTAAGSAVAGTRRPLCGTCLSTTFTGLPPSTGYLVKVTAVNSVGNSPTATSPQVVTPAVAPSAPNSVTAAAGIGSATVSWTAPDSDGGASLSSYVIAAVRSADGVTGPTVSVCGTCLTTRVSGLDAGTAYYFRVTATNSANLTGPAGQSNTIDTPAAQPPDAPSVPQPAEGQVLAAVPTELSVLYRDPDGDSGTVTATLTSVDSGQTLGTVTSALTGSDSRSVMTGPALAALVDGSYNWTAVATDNTGRASAAATFTFQVRTADGHLGYAGRAGWAGAVNTALGNFVHSETDVVLDTAGPELSAGRTYNSLTDRQSGFGPGWTHTFGVRWTGGGGGNVAIDWPDGRREVHTRQGDGTFTAPKGFYTRLVAAAGGGYTLATKDRAVYTFDAAGRLLSITDASGRAVGLGYVNGELDRVTDAASGRFLDYDWTAGKISRVTTNPVSGTAAGLSWTYEYTGGLLTAVCTPRSSSTRRVCTTYGYTAGSKPLLNSVTRPLGNRDTTVDYRPDRRVNFTQNGAGDRTSFAYPQASVVRVTDGRGHVSEQEHDSELRLTRETGPTGKTSRYGYDAAGNRQSVTDGANQTATVKHDANGNPTTITNPAGESTHATFVDDLMTVSRDGRSAGAADDTFRTDYGYDARRNRISEQTPPTHDHGRITRTWAFSDGTEAAFGGGTVPPGLELRSTDGRGNNTTFAYDSRGDLRERTDPSGLLTRYSYDGLGRMLTETTIDAAAEADSRQAATTWTYDGHSNVTTVTAPAVVNQVTGTTHQARTVNTWDDNDNLLKTEDRDLRGGQPTRTTRHEYDLADRQKLSVDATGGQTSRSYDGAGNLATATDAEGRSYQLVHEPRNLLASVTLIGFRDDPIAGSTPRNLPLARMTYDDAGRQRTFTDAAGRTVVQAYDGADRPKSSTLQNYRDLGGAARHVELSRTDYDKAGNAVLTVVGGARNPLTTRTVYDAASWIRQVITDPAGLARTTTFTRDRNGNPVLERRTAAGTTRAEEARRVFDRADRTTEETVENGTQDLIRRTGYDQRGNAISSTDPRGTVPGASAAAFTTNVSYDVLSRPRRTISPPVVVDDGTADTAPTAAARPTGITGYDTWGNPTHQQDARSNVTVTELDALDRAIRIQHPAYTRPDGELVTPQESFGYDKVGNLTRQTSRRGHTSEYVFDALNRVISQTDPAADDSTARGVTRHSYDDVGNLLQTIDPVGARTQTSYDDRNRPRTASQIVRDPDGDGPGVGGTFTTVSDYDDQGQLVLSRGATRYGERTDNPSTPVDESYAVTTWQRNAAGEAVAATDPTGAVSRTAYDLAGRPAELTDPLGRRTVTDYDLAGRAVQVRRYDTPGAQGEPGSLLTTSSTAYDAAGNAVRLTSPRGHLPGADSARFTTSRSIDALNRLVGVVIPTSADQAADLTTSYGYDAAGNHTRTVDGRGNTTRTAYTSWNLPATITEPATQRHSAEADRTWSLGYDAGGLADTEAQPGGVSVERAYDRLGRLTDERGQGPDAPAASKSYGYDLAGRRTALSHPGGQIAARYDDRGLLVSTTGGAGESSFGYDGDTRMTRRADAAGTVEFTWTARNELRTARDSLSGVTRTWQRNPAGELQQMTSSAGVVRDYAYDGLSRLLSDVQRTADGDESASHRYSYDADGNLTSQTVAFPEPPPLTSDPTRLPVTVNAGEGRQAYCYDHAGRLIRWDKALPIDVAVPDDLDDCGTADSVGDATDVIDYRYDNAGNRTAAGADQFSYDERNRLLTGPAGGYTHTARGTLAASTDGAQTREYTFDGLGRQVLAGGVGYSYDALDRIAVRSTGAGTPAAVDAEFAYAGVELDPVDDQTNDPSAGGTTSDLGGKYARSPVGRLFALTQNGAAAQQALLNRHGDLVGLTTSAGEITDTRLYDPFGKTSADSTSGVTPTAVGFQGDWTDPATSQVWMGARWYQPANASFTRRDTVHGELTTPVSLNRYTYAHNNPLAYIDPDGRRITAVDDPHKETREQRALSVAHATYGGGNKFRRQAQAWDDSVEEQLAKDPRTFLRRVLRRELPEYSVLEDRRTQIVGGKRVPNSANEELLRLIETTAEEQLKAGLDSGATIEYLRQAVRDQIGPGLQKVYDGAVALGDNNARLKGLDLAGMDASQRSKPRLIDVLSFLPFTGTPASAGLASESAAKGDYPGAAMNALGALPIAGQIGKGIKGLFRVARGARHAGAADEGLAAALKAAPTPSVRAPKPAGAGAPAPAAGGHAAHQAAEGGQAATRAAPRSDAPQELYGPFHRRSGPQTADEMAAARAGTLTRVEGGVNRNGFQRSVDAHTGPLPDGYQGYEFMTPVKPRAGSTPGYAQWPEGHPGVFEVSDARVAIACVVTRCR